MKHQEYQLQKQICTYLKLQYPTVLFLSDLSGQPMTMLQAVRNKAIQKDGFSCPDLLILEPRLRGNYHGLFLELKKESPFKKNGQLKSNLHLMKQHESIKLLQERNYVAQFVWTFDDAKLLIDDYLNNAIPF